jgi:hypothetical protein
MVMPSPRVGAIVGKATPPEIAGTLAARVVAGAEVGVKAVEAGVGVASSPQAARPRQTSPRSKTNFNFKLLASFSLSLSLSQIIVEL